MNVEMTDEQARSLASLLQAQEQPAPAKPKRSAWSCLADALILAVLLLALGLGVLRVSEWLGFFAATDVSQQLPATTAPVLPTTPPLPTPYIPAPAAAPAIAITVVALPPPTATPCTDTFYNAQSGRNECAGMGGGGGGPYGTPEPEPPAPGQPGFVESFQSAPDNGAFVGCLTMNCNPGAAPTPWPTSGGPQPGEAGFVNSFH